MSLKDLVAAAAQRLKLNDREPVRKMMLDNGLGLVLAGALHLFSDSYNEVTAPSERPTASRLTRHQAGAHIRFNSWGKVSLAGMSTR